MDKPTSVIYAEAFLKELKLMRSTMENALFNSHIVHCEHKAMKDELTSDEIDALPMALKDRMSWEIATIKVKIEELQRKFYTEELKEMSAEFYNEEYREGVNCYE